MPDPESRNFKNIWMTARRDNLFVELPGQNTKNRRARTDCQMIRGAAKSMKKSQAYFIAIGMAVSLLAKFVADGTDR